jgi:hypothetical protein
MDNPSRQLMLEFSSARGQPSRLGPFPELRFVGGTLVANGTVIAKHEDHQWRLTDDGIYSRLECSQRVTLHFEAGTEAFSRELGAYGSFSSVDGIAYTDGHVFAIYDKQTGDWYSSDLGNRWKALVVSPG